MFFANITASAFDISPLFFWLIHLFPIFVVLSPLLIKCHNLSGSLTNKVTENVSPPFIHRGGTGLSMAVQVPFHELSKSTLPGLTTPPHFSDTYSWPPSQLWPLDGL